MERARAAPALGFGRAGVELVNERDGWTAGVRLRAYGCAESASGVVEELATAEPVQGVSVRYEHMSYTGPLHEWYRRASSGLEQGFSIERSPCSGLAATARLELAVAGLRPVLSAGPSVAAGNRVSRTPQEVLLLDERGQACLRYSDARAEDATGRALPVAIDVRGDRILLTLGLERAVFPVSIDPLIAVQQGPELNASDGAPGDFLGFSAALAGDTALLGAPGHEVEANPEQGSVYSFVRSMGEWAPSDTAWVAADGALGDSFGFSLAVSGNSAVVGAPGHRVGDNPYQGAAYAFVRQGASWLQQGAALVADDGLAADAFGSSVAISDDTILVGAPAHDIDSKTDQGAAYVFVRAGTAWTQQGPALLAADGRAGDTFGSEVALSGDTALVGAPVHQVGVNPYQGAAYVFARSDAKWRQQGGDLVAPDGGAFDQLGPCAVSGDTALVGVPLHTVGTNPSQGAAYVFVRSGETWAQQGPSWTVKDGAAGDLFGSSVALFGDTALVAAPQHFEDANDFRGAGYLFARSEASWTQQGPELSVRGGASNELLGASVALSVDTALLGAPFHRVAKDPEQGAAFAFGLATTTCTAGLPCGDLRCAVGACCQACAGRCATCPETLHPSGGCACTATGHGKPRTLGWVLLSGAGVMWYRRSKWSWRALSTRVRYVSRAYRARFSEPAFRPTSSLARSCRRVPFLSPTGIPRRAGRAHALGAISNDLKSICVID